MKIKLGANEPLTILNSQGGVVFQTFTANAVDLGLPSGTLWADCNVGADNPEDPGLYFQWGDNEGFSKDSGKYCYGECVGQRNWTGDYSATHGCMLGDDLNIPVDPYFDAARKHMGSPWRMPTKQEIQELFNDSYTAYQWTTRNDMNGCLVTSKSNGNSIFLPAAGYFDEGHDEFGGNGYYWSSSFSGEDNAYYLCLSSGDVDPDSDDHRYCGYSVRAVCKMEFVDLGLPSGLKWATCNLGAVKPYETGLYYSWGNIQGHTATEGYNFDSATYNTTLGHALDGDIPVNADYDAAVAARGNGWRMPTKDDFQELCDNCTQTWTTKNGINGYEIEGPNGNKIFLPASGCGNGTSVNVVGTEGNYWSSSFRNANDAQYLYFDSGGFNHQAHDERSYGFSVRPVQNQS